MLRTLLFASAVAAASTANYTCTTFTLPVSVHNVTAVVPFFKLTDGFAAVELCNAITRRGAPVPALNTTQLTKTYNISAEYCAPNKGSSSTLPVLAHGIGFDRAYWDYRPPGSPMLTNYSYIAAAMAAGYSTFSYDRLGIAPSTLVNPITEVQPLVERAILINLTTTLRAGRIPQVARPKRSST